ncbi:hypothetical protein LguiB_011604 [Lonicera macranthoides]
MSSGDWMCSSCQEINFKRRDMCRRCNHPKFDNISYTSTDETKKPVVLAGDWYCNAVNCGAHNFASRAFCYWCNAPKYSCYTHNDGEMCSNYAGECNVLPPGWKIAWCNSCDTGVIGGSD